MPAGWAPTGPEVQDNNFTPQPTQTNPAGPVAAQGEIGSDIANTQAFDRLEDGHGWEWGGGERGGGGGSGSGGGQGEYIPSGGDGRGRRGGRGGWCWSRAGRRGGNEMRRWGEGRWHIGWRGVNGNSHRFG